MQIRIMSKDEAEKYSLEPHNESSIVISITSRTRSRAFVVPCKINKIEEVLYLEFNDTTDSNYMSGGIDSIDAFVIKEFIKKYENSNIDLCIVNCENGESRSAGVGAAIMEYLTGSSDSIFNDDRYNPNELCYITVLHELNKKE